MKIVKEPDIVASYSEDALGIKGHFEGVFRPGSEDEIAEFVRESRELGRAITPQGFRSSLTGASMCDRGVALSMGKFSKIIDIDVKGKRAIVEPGVLLSDFKKAVSDMGLYYPPDPTSEGECTIGGNIATNASGSRALKYGSTIEWVRRLRLVDGRGSAIEVENGFFEKNCAGYGAIYKPVSVFVGSEGSLGVITEIEVSLTVPGPEFFLIMVFFSDLTSVLDFVIEARENPKLSPCSIEFLDEACLEIIRPRAEGVSIPRDAETMVYLEQEYADDNDKERLMEEWFIVIERHTAMHDDTLIAMTRSQKDHLLDLRHHVPEKMNDESRKAVRNGGCKISTDWAVPYWKLKELFEYFDTISHRLRGMPVTRFAHIGQGHPHFNFIARNSEERKCAEEVDTLMATKAVSLGGTIAGEHGIGKMKREHIRLQYSPGAIMTMKAIKREFDPRGIMAPGNIFL